MKGILPGKISNIFTVVSNNDFDGSTDNFLLLSALFYVIVNFIVVRYLTGDQ